MAVVQVLWDPRDQEARLDLQVSERRVLLVLLGRRVLLEVRWARPVLRGRQDHKDLQVLGERQGPLELALPDLLDLKG